jgi:hypothetical protein
VSAGVLTRDPDGLAGGGGHDAGWKRRSPSGGAEPGKADLVSAPATCGRRGRPSGGAGPAVQIEKNRKTCAIITPEPTRIAAPDLRRRRKGTAWK